MPEIPAVAPGDQLPPVSYPVRRESMIRYAGASGDFNPIHWDERFAKQVGLPDVIAHGMLTMGLAVRAVTDWVGDPAAVVDYGVRFTRPVVVPAGAQVLVEVQGTVRSVDAAAGTAVIDLATSVAGQTVLARARATVRLGHGAAVPEVIVVRNNQVAHQYELLLNDQVASLVSYSEHDGVVKLPRTVTMPAAKGRGLAGRLVRFALEDIAERRLTVDPVCPYVVSFIGKHPEYAGLVAS